MTESATRDGEIPAIFNPKRVRTPSVVVTGDSPNGPSPFSGLTNIIPQITHSDSVTSSQPGDGVESLTGIIIGDHVETQSQGSQQHHSLTLAQQNQVANSTSDEKLKSKGCKGSCCSELAQKIYFGVFVTILITFSFVGATHCFRFLYLVRNSFITSPPHTKLHHSPATTQRTTNTIIQSLTALPYSQPASQQHSTNGFFMDTANISNNNNINNNLKIQKPVPNFNAPFFASWFCTNFNILFFPIYLFGRGFARKCGANTETLGDILRGFRDRGFTIGRFINRCLTFCILWLVTTYLYLLSLRSLFATDVMALFATNVSSVYLLSWVILHEQFVGVRIVAVILVDTGIALLAYMDGITGSPILVGVVLAALSAAGYAVFRVMFRKMLGDAPVGQIAFTFSIIGFLNAALLWPICLILYFSGVETMPWETLTVSILLVAAILLTCFHLLTQFSGAVTYNMFVTLGLITSVPVSAALDIVLYGAHFAGMKLGGIILISVGFFLVMFPNNWPDYITRLLRKTGRALLRNQCCCDYGEIDYENSKYHPVRTQCQMEPPFSQPYPHKSSRKNRLSHRLHSISSSFTLGKSPVTEQNLQLYQLQNHFDSMENYEYGNQTEPRNSFFFPSSPLNKNRNDSITETNFSIGGLNLIRKHRDSYTSLD